MDSELQERPEEVAMKTDMITLPDKALAAHFDLLYLEIAISQMWTKSTPGPDIIELMMVKMLQKLLELYNAWKEARVITLLELSDKDVANPGSYHPICCLTVLSKVLEKLLLNHMRAVFDEESSALQFCFKPGYLMEVAIEVTGPGHLRISHLF